MRNRPLAARPPMPADSARSTVPARTNALWLPEAPYNISCDNSAPGRGDVEFSIWMVAEVARSTGKLPSPRVRRVSSPFRLWPERNVLRRPSPT